MILRGCGANIRVVQQKRLWNIYSEAFLPYELSEFREAVYCPLRAGLQDEKGNTLPPHGSRGQVATSST